MRAPGSWLTRTGNGLLCASLLLSAVAHVASGGRLPGAGAVLLVFAILAVLGTALFGARQRRFDVTVLVLGSLQFALHLVFHLLTARTCHPAHEPSS
ncbi:hypothetical protein [Streptomyces sp. NPDC060035]|uniref:hypothetical protein n=1 Tax=Streptomyces sp. NPDC060035 TaxID=3347044 RepID=UPI0036A09525